MLTYWDLYLVGSWNQYRVGGQHNYEQAGRGIIDRFLARYQSYRAADPRDRALASTYPVYFCNASGDGYIPVPVIEGQAVITQ